MSDIVVYSCFVVNRDGDRIRMALHPVDARDWRRGRRFGFPVAFHFAGLDTWFESCLSSTDTGGPLDWFADDAEALAWLVEQERAR